MFGEVSNGWGFLGAAVVPAGALAYLIVQQRLAKTAAASAAAVASETKVTAEETKATVDQTNSLISDVAATFDAATIAGLLNESNQMLAQSSAQLVRCQEENRQLVAIVKVMERKVEAHERELVSLRSAFDGITGTTATPAKRPPRRKTET